MKKHIKSLLIISSIIFICLIFFSVSFYSFLKRIDSYDCVESKPEGLIVVLAGGPGRIHKGLSVLSNSKQSILVLSGVGENSSLKDIVNSAGYNNPIHEKQIIIDRTSKSTYENAIEVNKILSLYHFSNITIITSNIHMPRSLLIFRKLLPDNIKIDSHPICEYDGKLASLFSNKLKWSVIFFEFIKYYLFKIKFLFS
ncbi:MAG: YdcF family protein [Pseudomonadota bacterium]